MPRKIGLFALVSLVALWAGWTAAFGLYSLTHHRYHRPSTGRFYSSLHGKLWYSPDDNVDWYYFDVDFDGHSSNTNWCWNGPPAFYHTELDVMFTAWRSKGGATDIEGKLLLPSFELRSGESTIILTRELFRELMAVEGRVKATHQDLEAIDTVYDYFVEAANGTLPPSGHHGAIVPEPLYGSLGHWAVGYRIPKACIVWVFIWAGLVVRFGRRTFDRSRSPRPNQSTVT